MTIRRLLQILNRDLILVSSLKSNLKEIRKESPQDLASDFDKETQTIK